LNVRIPSTENERVKFFWIAGGGAASFGWSRALNPASAFGIVFPGTGGVRLLPGATRQAAVPVKA
jgi:hypothetical protein